MIETRLLLIEGPPGSGKSTTAWKLADEISKSGKACQSFLEWSDDNPIKIGDDHHLDQVTTTSITRADDVLRQWQQFAQARLPEETVTVMESRFWQTSVMLMYAAGLPIEGVIEHNQRVIETIQVLKPVLIYFTIDDLRGFLIQMVQGKEEEWRRAGYKTSWSQHVYDAFESQKWFTDRNLTGLSAVLTFLEEWALVTETLYARLPFPKTKIRNPHTDWSLAMRQIHGFLGLV